MTAWIEEKVHQESHQQDGPGGAVPLCAILTGVNSGPMTDDEQLVTCDACKAIGMAMDRGNVIQITTGKA